MRQNLPVSDTGNNYSYNKNLCYDLKLINYLKGKEEQVCLIAYLFFFVIYEILNKALTSENGVKYNMLLIEECLEDIDFDIKPDKKLYINDEGKMVPRVTDVLSKCIFEGGLVQWANSLGFKHIGYTRELNRTATIGTKAHRCIERFFKNGEMDIKNISFMGFMRWWNHINENNNVELLASEMKLVCKYFGGTLDALIKINGKIYLVDFKTSNHITYKHMLQLAAYRYMLYVVKGINVDGTIILQLDKEIDTYREYVLDFTNKDHYNFIEDCARCFLSLVYSYYNLIYIDQQYKMIF